MHQTAEWQRAPEWAAQRALVKSLWNILARSLLTIVVAHLLVTVLLSFQGHPLEFRLYLLEILLLVSVAFPALHLAILRPVTRLAAEQAAASAETRFRVIADAIQDAILILGTDERIRYANSAARRIFRAAENDLVGASARGLAPPHTLEVFEQAMQRLRAGAGEEDLRVPGPFEYDALRADGEVFPVEVSVSRLHEEREALFILVLRDITERKQAEEALRAGERRYRELLELLPVPVRINQGGRICYANAADAHAFGFAGAEEIVGKDALSFIIPEQHERLAGYHKRRMAGEDAPAVYRTTALRADGTPFDIEVTAVVVEFGGAPASLLVLRDLSIHQRLEMLEQILPVCCVCGKIRDDSGAAHGAGDWGKLDDYVRRHTDAQFSHTFCPDCYADFRRAQGLGRE